MPLQFSENPRSGGALNFSSNRVVLSSVGFTEASQAEAEAGAATGRYMSPLRTTQNVTARLATQVQAESGADTTQLMTPTRTTQLITARLASSGEAITGTDAVKLITPATMAAALDDLTASEIAFTPVGTIAATDVQAAIAEVATDAAAAVIPIASQSEAEAGVNNATVMTPLRVAQRTTAILATEAEAKAGTDNTKLMTPLRSAQAIGVMSAVNSRSWNAEYQMWQRGTSFAGLTVAAFTSDRCINGPGSGGTFTVDQITLTATQRTAIDNGIYQKPRWGKRFNWSVAPTAGEGRTGYTEYFSAEEMRDDDVQFAAGKTITVSAWVWTSAGTLPFFLYASQGLGVAGDNGGSGNTISGTGAGTDYDFFAGEIFNRSSQKSATTTPQLFSFSATLDTLALASSIGNDNAFTIGLGLNYNAIVAGQTLECTLLKYDFGSLALPTAPRPDAEIHDLSQYNYQRFGRAVTGVAISTTELRVALPFRSRFKGAAPSAINLLTTTPAFRVAGTDRTGTASAITATQSDYGGANIIINGFTSLTAGDAAVYNGAGSQLLAEAIFE